MNKCCFSARLCADADVTTFQTGSKKARFRLAVNNPYLNKTTQEWEDNTAFLDCECWGDRAVRAGKLLKGQYVIIDDCSAKTDSWEDKTSGDKRSRIIFTVNHFELPPANPLGKATEATDNAEEQPPKSRKPRKSRATQEEDEAVTSLAGDEEIPF